MALENKTLSTLSLQNLIDRLADESNVLSKVSKIEGQPCEIYACALDASLRLRDLLITLSSSSSLDQKLSEQCRKELDQCKVILLTASKNLSRETHMMEFIGFFEMIVRIMPQKTHVADLGLFGGSGGVPLSNDKTESYDSSQNNNP